jgi:hypothetical protein
MIDLILFCFGTASLTLFLDMCMDEGMIFSWWYKFIQRVGENRLWLFKVLGGCTYCYGTWIFICTYLAISSLSQSVFPYNSFILAVYGILGIGFNYVFIKVIEKI